MDPSGHNKPERPLVIGLTGGIGSGKSTIADFFTNLGITVIDADAIARALVEPGQAALQELAASFGEQCINADGRLDRAWLRDRVFADETRRHRLEAILHPRIRMEISRLIMAADTPYCVVVIPLLLETQQGDLVDRVLVVDCTEDRQLARASARDGSRREQVQAIMAAQASRAQRLAIADDVITNDGTLDELREQVRLLHEKYLALAGPGTD